MKKIIVSSVIILLVLATGWYVFLRPDAPAATEVQPTKNYVALGDSVAAGIGLQPDSDASACNRTDKSYPQLLARRLNYNLTNLACSGATLATGISGGQEVNKLLLKPQLEQLYAVRDPALITFTVGANDVHWTDVLAKCYVAVCGTPEDTAASAAVLTQVTAQYRSALTALQQHYGTAIPKVVITGYYQVFPATVPAGCNDLTGIDSAELAWGRKFQTDINNAVEQAAVGLAFVSYQPIDFEGHELCAADSWVQGIGDKQPYHPMEAGQAAIASQINKALSKQVQARP